MADDAPAGTPSFLRRKVAGIPVLYLLGAGVLVLAVVAWRLKGSTMNDQEATTAQDTDTGDESGAGAEYGAASGGDGSSQGYSGFTSNPTPTYDPTLADTTTVPTQDSWIQNGATYADAAGLASYDKAQAILQKYVSGEQLSYDEGAIRDAVIRHNGAPPELVTTGGTAAQTAHRQGNPPTTHTISGNDDDTFGELAALYYGNKDSNHIDVIQAANTNLANNGPFVPGTKVMIPAYHAPVFYKTTGTKDDTAAEIAAKNGVTGGAEAIMRLNDGMKFPVKKGTKVRVS